MLHLRYKNYSHSVRSQNAARSRYQSSTVSKHIVSSSGGLLGQRVAHSSKYSSYFAMALSMQLLAQYSSASALSASNVAQYARVGSFSQFFSFFQNLIFALHSHQPSMGPSQKAATSSLHALSPRAQDPFPAFLAALRHAPPPPGIARSACASMKSPSEAPLSSSFS